VDMNISGDRRDAVENITWSDKGVIREGTYILEVNNFYHRESKDIGFTVEIECAGELHTFNYAKEVKHKETIKVAEFSYTKKEGIKIINSIPSSSISKEIWGIKTGNFRKVKMIMNSPNHWDGENTGNKHWFFILDGCKNEGTTRGFYNEFLREDLTKHRKVFEVLGSKMITSISDNQLSGIGFSSTQRNSIICKVSGTFNRTIKIIF